MLSESQTNPLDREPSETSEDTRTPAENPNKQDTTSYQVNTNRLKEENIKDSSPKTETLNLEESLLDDETRERVEAILGATPIVLLIKGDAERPFCKFSKRIVSLLISRGISFSSFDVKSLDQTDDKQKALYMGFKKYGNFPTFPQLYVNKELVGGLDVCTSLDDENELIHTINNSLLQSNTNLKNQSCISSDVSEIEWSKTRNAQPESFEKEFVQVNIRYVNGNIHQIILKTTDTVERLYEYVLNNFSQFDSQFKKPFLIAYPGLGKKVLDKNYLHTTLRECFSTEEFEQELKKRKSMPHLKIIPLTIYYLPSSAIVPPKTPRTSMDGQMSLLFTQLFKSIVTLILKKPIDLLTTVWGKVKWW
ncbi:hypothetical protein C9374_009716 [Naegleria lovaniensis]|uniref:Glutaredoxin domain-containing protein n=1 Tax=Naegleria lovaniensis TaxID=51637 RepID=A0AA88H3S6_NAELO|nr:uncharacterized protein C9374_009716 [Naegleria lovaniensis]KAG2393139.1 hypothetical protein C9374_009716 [Naegleria lovaniensis]